ncbi:hypothetical protein HDV06_006907 [Boothiomyces sp. JEL0866]|nr:hypothetical protein HDV06_006907 [Boothiomyces sp. JEL0866]
MFTFAEITNPRPYTPKDHAEDLFENYLTREKLKQITGKDELDKVEYLELRVDSRKTGLGEIEDLDGICSFINLKELYLAYNQISEISDLGRLEFLQVLDLESNNIRKLSELEYLVLCNNLQNLTTEGNPIEFPDLSPDSPDYEMYARQQILALLPDIKILDDIPVEPKKRKQRPSTSYGRRAKSPINEIKPELIRPNSSLGERSIIDASSALTMGQPLAGNPILMLRKKKSNPKPDILVLDSKPDILVLDTPKPPITKKESKTPRKFRVSEPEKLLQALYLNEPAEKPVKIEKNIPLVNQM